MTNLYADIETIPDQDEGALENARELVKVPANYKKPEAIERYRLSNAAEAYEKTALNGLHGEICSIAWALGDGEIQGHIRKSDEPESDVLLLFFESVVHDVRRNGEGAFPRLTWIGHNLIDFDLRFLKQRCIVNGIKPPFLIPADARHASNDVFDTMKAWAGWKGYVKQDALCRALGIESSSEEFNSVDLAEMDGSKVWAAYQRGDYDHILTYNKLDVWKVRELHKRMS